MIKTNESRDENLTPFSKATLTDRYLSQDETYQELFARVAKAYANDDEHAQRLYDYISKLWFMPATPILSNGGNNRGEPISCFLSEAQDTMSGIVDTWNEATWLACKGGGLGINWSNIRSLGERVGSVGKSSGVIPFLKVQDALTLAISQGSLRRGSAAVYLDISHPEIEEFIEMRRPTGGDPNRKCLNLHHGVTITDEFMNAVKDGKEFVLRSPKDKEPVRTIKARDLWARLLTARMETGEPYLLFIDNVNRVIPDHHKILGLNVRMSNLCSEITLPTGKDHRNEERTAVCCLSSLNLEKYEEWKGNKQFILDVMYFLDNVIQSFIDHAEDTHKRAKYSAMRERSVGLGVMGLHYLYQSKDLPFGSPEAYSLNIEIFSELKRIVQEANTIIAEKRGACPDAKDAGIYNVRFSNTMAIAPTASISVICGGTSPSIEPLVANCFMHKTLSGSFFIKNRYLEELLEEKGMNTDEVWSTITSNMGSVQHLEFLSDEEKAIFRTAKEIDQMDLIFQAADRQPYIDQAQSLNLFFYPGVSKKFLHITHFKAWELGVKSLYYCRSDALNRGDKISQKVKRDIIEEKKEDECVDGVCSITPPKPTNNYEACESCQ